MPFLSVMPNLYAADVEKSAAFYRDLLGGTETFRVDGHVELRIGDVVIAISDRGDKRLALAAVTAFYGLNGRRLTLTNDQAYDLIMSVAAGQLDTVDAIAAILQPATRSRG